MDQLKNIEEKKLERVSFLTLLIILFQFLLLHSKFMTLHHVMHHVTVVTYLFIIQKKKKKKNQIKKNK